MNLLQKGAILAPVVALIALVSDAAPAVLALVKAEGDSAACATPRAYAPVPGDRVTSGFAPASATWPAMFDASWH